MTTPRPRTEPLTELDSRYSSPGAAQTAWATARDRLAAAGTYALSTVRPDGRPHVTPVIGVWFDGALWFCTGHQERKARNLVGNRECVLTVGSSAEEGLDVVVEGEALRERDHRVLRQVADAYLEKYGPTWHFDVRDGDFHSEGGGPAAVFRVRPRTAFGFVKGEPYGQTRWSFTAPSD